MSAINAYIGELESPRFDWDNGDWNGNIPKKISPFFLCNAYAILHRLLLTVQESHEDCKRTDFGSITYRMFPSEMQDLLSSVDALDKSTKEFIVTLNPKKKYALVAYEGV